MSNVENNQTETTSALDDLQKGTEVFRFKKPSKFPSWPFNEKSPEIGSNKKEERHFLRVKIVEKRPDGTVLCVGKQIIDSRAKESKEKYYLKIEQQD